MVDVAPPLEPPTAPKKRSRKIGVYELGKKIGKGAFSTVRKAVNIFTKQEVIYFGLLIVITPNVLCSMLSR
jgi:serine/threonine protein kinase